MWRQQEQSVTDDKQSDPFVALCFAGATKTSYFCEGIAGYILWWTKNWSIGRRSRTLSGSYDSLLYCGLTVMNKELEYGEEKSDFIWILWQSAVLGTYCDVQRTGVWVGGVGLYPDPVTVCCTACGFPGTPWERDLDLSDTRCPGC